MSTYEGLEGGEGAAAQVLCQTGQVGANDARTSVDRVDELKVLRGTSRIGTAAGDRCQ